MPQYYNFVWRLLETRLSPSFAKRLQVFFVNSCIPKLFNSWALHISWCNRWNSPHDMFGMITWLCLTFPTTFPTVQLHWISMTYLSCVLRNCAMWEGGNIVTCEEHVLGRSERSGLGVDDNWIFILLSCYTTCAGFCQWFRGHCNIMWHHLTMISSGSSAECWKLSGRAAHSNLCVPIWCNKNDSLLGKTGWGTMPDGRKDGRRWFVCLFYAEDLEISKTNTCLPY